MRAERRGTRASGTNPRAQLTNPRALGTNPSAGAARDAVRVFNARELALTTMHNEGVYHCDRCSDTAWIPCTDRRDLLTPCGCRPITAREAQAWLLGLRKPGERPVSLAAYQRASFLDRRPRRRL